MKNVKRRILSANASLSALFGTISLAISVGGCKTTELPLDPIHCQGQDELAAILADTQWAWDPQSGDPIELEPDSLRVLLLQGNMNLLQAANRVHQAKGALNLARASLLPSINLGVLVQGSKDPTFLASTVDFALPFLLPSKWFDLHSKKNLLKAEEMAFLATELNQYASLYALYLAIHADYEARDFLAQDYQDALTVERLVDHAHTIGQATSADLDLARSQVLSAENRLLKFEELLTEEMASLRYAMAICPEVPLSFKEHTLAPSPLEGLGVREATTQVLTQAPEARQMDYLLRAAELERWSKVWGFLGSGSVGGIASASGNAFSNISGSDVRAQMGLGFGYVAALSLSNRHIEQLRLRKMDLSSETLKTMESTLGRIGWIASRIENSERAEALLSNVFESEKRRYLIGDTTLLSLTEAQGRLRQMRLEKIRAEFDQKLERLTLHRLSLEEAFSTIKGCDVSEGPNPCDVDFVRNKTGSR